MFRIRKEEVQVEREWQPERQLWDLMTVFIWHEKKGGPWRLTVGMWNLKKKWETKRDVIRSLEGDSRKLAELIKNKIRASLEEEGGLVIAEVGPWRDVRLGGTGAVAYRWMGMAGRGQWGIQWGGWRSGAMKKSRLFDSSEKAAKWFERNWEKIIDYHVEKWEKERVKT